MANIKARIAQIDRIASRMAEYNQATYNLGTTIESEASEFFVKCGDDWAWETTPMNPRREMIRECIRTYARVVEVLDTFQTVE